MRLVITLVLGITLCSHAQTGQYWVYFRDKIQEGDIQKVLPLEWNISSKSLMRRHRRSHSGAELDEKDRPVSPFYIAQIRDLGISVAMESRWLNAVSVRATPQEMKSVAALPFVRKIGPMGHVQLTPPQVAEAGQIQGFSKLSGNEIFNYGLSHAQISAIAVPALHGLGLSGKGVNIGLIDTGFDFSEGEVFSQTDVVKQYDFIWDDRNVANDSQDVYTQDHHGTEVLSLIGGFKEGKLIGTAYGATYWLAKTEWTPTELRMEEDSWVAAIEWMEREGVDVVSSSLGYTRFDDGSGYVYEDLDGNTAVTTIAADIAVSKGMVVVTSSGNERNHPWFYLSSPADGDSVIAVGAVTPQGNLASFSSGGPTSDGRIKPDVVAVGAPVYSFYPDAMQTNAYAWIYGTSFSAPQVAGVCALLLEARPELTPMEIRTALRKTASQSEFPDNELGWGLVNARRALFFHGPVVHQFKIKSLATAQQISFEIITPLGLDNRVAQFFYKMNQNDSFDVLPVQVSGADSVFTGTVDLPGNMAIDDISFYVALDESVAPVGAPQRVYAFSELNPEVISIPLIHVQAGFKLSNGYPNPFSEAVSFQLSFPNEGHATLTVFNVLGQKVNTLWQQAHGIETHTIIWNGRDDQGAKIPKGVYIAVLKSDQKFSVTKVVYTGK